MQKQFTHQFMLNSWEFMLNNFGCYANDRLMECSFMQNDTVTLMDILNSEIPLADKYWFVCRRIASEEQNQQIAISVAEITLPIFENKHPDDQSPRQAIEATKQYLAGTISIDQLMEKRRAAAATISAYSMALTAYSAAPTADYAAAYAAKYAVYAAAIAAYAAYDISTLDVTRTTYIAARAAGGYAATDAGDIKLQLLTYLINFCNSYSESD